MVLEKDFKTILNDIKYEIKNTQRKTIIEANSNLIRLYFKLGKIIEDNSQYGNYFIENVSTELNLEFPKIQGFSVRNLKYMKKFYNEYKDDEKVQQLVAQLPWGHNILLIDKIKDKEIRKKYIEGTLANGWSRSVLTMQIESDYHLRIGTSSNNFNTLLPSVDSDLVNNSFKDPYIFDFITLNQDYKERELEEALLDKIRDVLLELGKGFSFVGNQYKISTGETDYYIDLLFYHLDLRCYIVVELKANKFKPEYTGQLGFYVTAVDETLKKKNDNSTIGLLLCKDKDRLSVDWTLKSTNVPIGVSSFEVKNILPKEILDKLPTEEDLNLHIDID